MTRQDKKPQWVRLLCWCGAKAEEADTIYKALPLVLAALAVSMFITAPIILFRSALTVYIGLIVLRYFGFVV